MILWLAACSGSAAPVPDVPFQLPSAASGPIRFVAVGDTGKGNTTQHTVAAGIQQVCASAGCDFALLLGDNLYPAGMVSEDDPRMQAVFTDVYGGLPLRFAAVLGNHDWGKSHQRQVGARQLAWAETQDQFVLPQRYYRFTSGDAAFWALDTDTVFWEDDSAQRTWLDRTLADSDATWKVVFGHHPYRSNGRHGNAGSYEGWSNVPYASGAALRELFDDSLVGHADLYLAGHDHNLQSFAHRGLQLVVSGAGASTRPLVDRGNPLSHCFAEPGFVWVELGDRLTIRMHAQDGRLLGERSVAPEEISRAR